MKRLEESVDRTYTISEVGAGEAVTTRLDGYLCIGIYDETPNRLHLHLKVSPGSLELLNRAAREMGQMVAAKEAKGWH